MPLDQVENFVEVNVSGDHSSTETTISLQSGEASNLPDPASGEFNLVWFDSTNFSRPSEDNSVEVVRVTGRDTTNDTITVLRGQENTTAVAHDTTNSDYVMILAQTAKMIEDVDAADFSTNTVTVAGNSVALGSSTAINHSDLSNIGTGDHHTRYSDEEAQDAVGGILNADFSYDDAGNSIALASNSLTVANTTIGLGGSGTPEADNLAGNNGSSGQVLQTDGSNASWTDLESETVKTVSSDITTSGESTLLLKSTKETSYANALYENKNFTSSESEALGFDIGKNGSKLYLSDKYGTVYQYTLSTDYDISTASYDSVSKDVTGNCIKPIGFEFRDDGTKLFTISNFDDRICSYSLSTAWDLSTASHITNFDVSNTIGILRDITFNDDGSKMYPVGSSDIYEYNLSTAWDLSTASYSGKTHNLNVYTSGGTDDPRGVSWNSDGSILICGGSKTTSLYIFEASTPYDIDSLGFFVNKNDVSSEVSEISSSVIRDSQDKLYLGSGSTLYQYNTFFLSYPNVTISSSDTTSGRIIRVKDISGDAGTSNINVDTESSETIDDSSSITLNTNYGVKQLQSDGSNWFIISDG
jgi:hypothetical protein